MQSYQNMSDEELIAALRSGEKEITDYLMDKYKSLVKKKQKHFISLVVRRTI